MKKIVLLSSAMLFFVFCANAQFKFQNGALLFNGPQWSTLSTTWNGWAHAWVSGSNTVSLNLSPADPRFGTNTGKIVFYKVDNSGFIDVYGKTFYSNSDIGAKINIAPLGSATSTILRLRPVTYQWKDHAQYMKENPRSTGIVNAHEFGFLAQDVEKVIPDIVVVDCEGHRLINYQAIISILTGSVQELNARIAALETEIKTLKAK
jgi:hypothetical protein